MYRTYTLDPDFYIDVAPAIPPLPEISDNRVSGIWYAAQHMQPELYNGRIYSLIESSPKRLLVRALEYRILFAQRRAPELASTLAVRPLGVTGLLTCREGLVVGHRAKHVAADAELWEAAPAGSLARPEPGEQILEELAEELGLHRSKVTLRQPLGLVEDLISHVVDIVFRIESDLSAGEVRAAWDARGTDEYADVQIVPLPELPRFLAKHRGRHVRVLEPMLRLGGFLSV